MTGSGGSISESAPRDRPEDRRTSARDPYGIAPAPSWVAPILATVGLVLVGWLTYVLVTAGNVSLPGPLRPGGGGPQGGVRTPAPSNVVVVPEDPRADVPGSIVYVKAGNVWIQSGTQARQLTRSGSASQPAFSPDGRWVYYIETIDEIGFFPAQGNPRRYAMEVPSLMRIASTGEGEPESLATGRVAAGAFSWFHWLRQPAPSADGQTIAILSDGPDPTQRNVVVQLFDIGSRQFTVPEIPETEPLGHQDPTWRPDGHLLLLVRNDRDGARGAATIVRWNPETGRTTSLTGPGYLSPAWSRDMRWIAATRTSSLGTNIVILDARTGAEVFRVTDDDRSWSPVWSPFGDAIAYLHERNGIVDLQLATLGGTAPTWQVTETIDLTEVSGLEATSRPGWFVPEERLPALPTPGPSRADGGSPEPASEAP